MTIEYTRNICVICDKHSETPFIQKKDFKDHSIHLCSFKCFRMYQAAVNSSQKKMDDAILKQANNKIKKEVRFHCSAIPETEKDNDG